MDRKKHHNLMMKIRKEFVVFLDLMLPLSYKPYLLISMYGDRNISFDNFFLEHLTTMNRAIARKALLIIFSKHLR